MTNRDNDGQSKNQENDKPLEEEVSQKNRRDFLKGSAVVAGGLAAAAAPGLVSAAESQQQDSTQDPPSKNPYGPRPGGGISLSNLFDSCIEQN